MDPQCITEPTRCPVQESVVSGVRVCVIRFPYPCVFNRTPGFPKAAVSDQDSRPFTVTLGTLPFV